VSTVKEDYISRARGVSDLKAHLVLTTKYRRKVFNKEMLDVLGKTLTELLEKWDCRLIEFNGETDHVHILFQYKPQICLSTLINNIKTVTSRKLRKDFLERLKKFYCQDVFWNNSYFIASCGGVTIEVLKKYVENQKEVD
jgi:putative transposase